MPDGILPFVFLQYQTYRLIAKTNCTAKRHTVSLCSIANAIKEIAFLSSSACASRANDLDTDEFYPPAWSCIAV